MKNDASILLARVRIDVFRHIGNLKCNVTSPVYLETAAHIGVRVAVCVPF